MSRRTTGGRFPVIRFAVIVLCLSLLAATGRAGPLDPRGKVHIPIGLPDTLDTLKTFVEAEGNFSPGVGSYGVYFWVYDPQSKKLHAPTADGAECEHGLAPGGYPIPWSRWDAGDLTVRSEACQVRRPLEGGGETFVVGSRVEVKNRTGERREFSLYVALRGVGPAGWAVRSLSVDGAGDSAVKTLLVEGRVAIAPDEQATAAGVLPTDTVGELATLGQMPQEAAAQSWPGDCSGALRFDVTLGPKESRTFGFVCPVLPGRRAVGHRWDNKSEWAQLDEAAPNPAEGGRPQPDPGIAYFRRLTANQLFGEAERYWKDFVGRATVRTPDGRWGEAFAAITAHAALAMNEGAPDVAVVNYNVFNRDGVYTTNILQKVGHFDLAEKCVDYFLARPFNGRVYPEADNPGQVLWIVGEHWKFTHDEQWLRRVYPSVKKLAGMVEYYRTTPGPHWVNVASLDYGPALPPEKRQVLEPGRCDWHHPEYTEAFDVAGLRAAARVAAELGEGEDQAKWSRLADSLFDAYHRRFGKDLRKEYGSYCVLWPTRLYPFGWGEGFEQFKGVGAQEPRSWRYFPLATAHQGLLAGNRAAAHETIDVHLDHEQMAGGDEAGRGWYAFDEGGKSGPGGWHHLRTTWNKDVAMPHGWAVAELHLLIRDSLLYEDGNRLALLAGVPPGWFTRPEGVEVNNLPTHFGPCSFTLKPRPDGKSAVLDLAGEAAPPGGFVLHAPQEPGTSVWSGGTKLSDGGATRIGAGTRQVTIRFEGSGGE